MRSPVQAGWTGEQLAALGLIGPVAAALVARCGVPWYRALQIGLVERRLVLCEVAAVVGPGVWVVTATRRTLAPLSASPARIAPAA